ncbi:MAG: class I SAM-dependent methyltransferase [Chloroflexota bacterium]
MTYSCPSCHALVEPSQDGYLCRNGHPFASYLGIPDFRVFDHPYVSRDEEMRRVNLLMEHYDSMSFEELVAFYLRDSERGHVPDELVRQYTRYRLVGSERGENDYGQFLQHLQTLNMNVTLASAALEVGCGTGGSVLALSRRFGEVVGVDAALEELVLARKRLEEQGVTTASLVCASAESLPFDESSFDFCNSICVIEHVGDQRATIQETYRVLKPNGFFFMRAPNRFTILPEGHVKVWGVGFLPRKFASRYVTWVKGIPYEGKRPLSYLELRGLIAESFKENYQIFTIPGTYADLSKPGSSFPGKIYRRLVKIPILNKLMRLTECCFLPTFEAVAFKGAGKL